MPLGGLDPTTWARDNRALRRRLRAAPICVPYELDQWDQWDQRVRPGVRQAGPLEAGGLALTPG